MGENAALKTEDTEALAPEIGVPTSDQENTLDSAINELREAGTPTPAPSGTAQVNSSNPIHGSNHIWDIPVDVNIIIGTAELTVARLMELDDGDVLVLNRRVGEPLDITVNGRNIAKGKIVMNENDESQFAIQITELSGG